MEAELRELLDKQAIAELLYAYGEGGRRTRAADPAWEFLAPEAAW